MIKVRPIVVSMVVVGLVFLVNVMFCHSLVCPVVLLGLLALIYMRFGLWGYLLLGAGYGVGLVSCYMLLVEMRGEVSVELHNLGGLSWRTLLFCLVYSSLGAVMVLSGVFIVRRLGLLRGCSEGVRYLGAVGVLSVWGTIFMVSGGVVSWDGMPSWVACVVLWAYFVIIVGVVLGVIFSLSGVRVCRNYGRGSLAHRYRVVVFLLVVGVVGMVMALILGCVAYGWGSEGEDFMYGYVVGVVVGVSSVVMVLLLGVMSLWFGRLLPRLARFRCGEALHSEREWQAKARGLTHDIRNPLTPIKLKLQMLRCGVCHKDSTVVLDELLEQVDMLSSVVEGEGSEERVDVVALVKSVVSLYSSYSLIRFAVGGLSEYYMSTSRLVLWRVLVNVVQNSVEAMGGEGELWIDIFWEGESLVIRVEDSGGGISDELLSSAFLAGVSTKGSGRGLGLALCRDSLASIGGTIELSRTTRGTVALISL